MDAVGMRARIASLPAGNANSNLTHTMTTEITELDRLADAFVEQDRTNVKLDAAENGVLDTAEMLRNMAAEQGGHWLALDSDDGEQALVWAIRNLRC